MNEYADNLAAGMAPDFPEYKYVVGQIHGLALAERIILDIGSRRISAED
jgi:hypothetical protein